MIENSASGVILITGQFKRYTLGLVIDDAYLFDVRVKDNLRIVEGQLHTMNDATTVADRELIFKK